MYEYTRYVASLREVVNVESAAIDLSRYLSERAELCTLPSPST